MTFFAALVAILLWPAPAFAEEPKDILNVSYDVSRELYADINKAFIPKYKADTGNDLTINQSHAGSSKQARAVLDGLKADAVTFNQFTDVQVLHDQGDLIIADWQSRLPNDSVPYYSLLPAFLVRKGNPKNIKDWNDLVRDDVQVVFPNPKTSGNGRYTYLAAYAYALEASKGAVEKTQAFGANCLPKCRCSTPAAARRRPPSSSAASAMCSSLSRPRCKASASNTARTRSIW